MYKGWYAKKYTRYKTEGNMQHRTWAKAITKRLQSDAPD